MYLYWRHGMICQSSKLPDLKFTQPDGMLAVGGQYTADCFIQAYKRGIFPWPNDELEENNLIPWFSPWERFVLEPENLHVSHSLKKTLKKHPFTICADRNFEKVITACANVPRNDQGTWITPGMIHTFCEMHEIGIAHSIECYHDDELVGGFYGTCFGTLFGGESMFSKESDVTKVAFATFVRRAQRFGIRLIDCQCYTDNLARYGAHDIPREQYLKTLELASTETLDQSFWQGEWQTEE